MNNLKDVLGCLVIKMGATRMEMLQEAIDQHSQASGTLEVHEAITGLILKGVTSIAMQGEEALVVYGSDGISKE